MKKKIILQLIVLAIFAISLFAGQKTLNKTFKAKKNIIIKNVSGDCTIKKGSNSEIVIKLVYTYSDDCFKPVFKEKGDELFIKEEFPKQKCKGKSSWIVKIPYATNINFSAASGDFSMSGIKGKVKVNTASGDIKVFDSKGDFKVNTASGDIDIGNLYGEIKFGTASGEVKGYNLDGKIKLNTASGNVVCKKLKGKVSLNSASGSVELNHSKGAFKLSSASGNVMAKDIELTAGCKFSTASGDVLVTLSKTAEFDLVLSSASGDAELNYQGNKITGYFEFTARKKKGDIVSPFAFEKEDTFIKYDKEYWKKSFTRGKSKPEIFLKTATGTAKLVK